jgi:hypothetical protein
MEWIDLAQDRDQWRDLAKVRVSRNVGKLLSSWVNVGLSVRTWFCGVGWSVVRYLMCYSYPLSCTN